MEQALIFIWCIFMNQLFINSIDQFCPFFYQKMDDHTLMDIIDYGYAYKIIFKIGWRLFSGMIIIHSGWLPSDHVVSLFVHEWSHLTAS